jgi:hypothetical protein
MVVIVLLALALSDLMFTEHGSFRLFLRRVRLSLLWPLALLSVHGRSNLFSGFKYTQMDEEKK